MCVCVLLRCANAVLYKFKGVGGSNHPKHLDLIKVGISKGDGWWYALVEE